MNTSGHLRHSGIFRLLNGFWPALGLMILSSLLVVQVGFAHAMLVKSDPQDHATLAESPAQIRMWFSEDVNVDLSNVTIMGGGGQDIGPILLSADPQQPALVVANIPKLAPGIYTVAYQVVSKMDGHKNEGSIVFGVGQTVGANSAGMGDGVNYSASCHNSGDGRNPPMVEFHCICRSDRRVRCDGCCADALTDLPQGG